jgi:outer membrane usher protein
VILRRLSHQIIYILNVSISFFFFSVSPGGAEQQNIQQPKFTEYLLSIEVNKKIHDDISLCLQDESGHVYVNQKDLEKWNIKLPQGATVTYQGEAYHSLKTLEKLRYDFNTTNMSLHIFTDPSCFNKHAIDFSQKPFVIPMESSPGLFMDYDAVVQKSRNNQSFGSIFGVGIFNKHGSGISNFLVQNTKGPGCTKNKFVRLNSDWRMDNPFEMTTLIMGDFLTVPGMWGRSVGLGGLQWRTDFGTQPTFITFPLPTATGEAVTPSIVDICVNGLQTTHAETPAGPFAVSSIPVTTGVGNVSLTTTDLLGRQQQLTIPYYASSALLKPGLEDFACSGGFVRKHFGRKSNDYGDFAFSGNYQRGITTEFTSESHVELMQKRQAFGFGGNYLISNMAILNVAGAGSYNSRKAGWLGSVGAQHQSFCDINVGANFQKFSKSFTQLGLWFHRAPQYLLSTSLGLKLYDGASFAISYVQQKNRHDRLKNRHNRPKNVHNHHTTRHFVISS